MLRNQGIDGSERIAIIMVGICAKGAVVLGATAEKGAELGDRQCVGAHAVSLPREERGIPKLLKLMLDRNGAVRFSKVECFGDQGESRIRNNGASAGEVTKEFGAADWFQGDGSLLLCLRDRATVQDGGNAERAHHGEEVGGSGGAVDEEMATGCGSQSDDFATEHRGNDERVRLDRARAREVGNHVRGAGGQHESSCGHGGDRIRTIAEERSEHGAGQLVLVINGDDRDAVCAREECGQRFKIGTHELWSESPYGAADPIQAAGELGHCAQISEDGSQVSQRILFVCESESANRKKTHLSLETRISGCG